MRGVIVLGTVLSVVGAAQNAVAEPTAPAASPSAPVAAPAAPRAPTPRPLPYARANRFALSLGFGFGSIALGGLETLSEDVARLVEAQGVTLDGDPTSGLQINGEIAFRYYFPYFVMAQVGYGTVYNQADVKFTAGPFQGKVSSDNLVMEVPILIGGYYPVIDRLYTFGALGPSVFFFPRSFWDASAGGIPDFKADPGVGFTALAGADFLVTEVLAVGLELRYRYLKTGELMERKTGLTAGTAVVGLDPSKTYDLDFSGISLGVVLRLYVH